MAAKKNFKATPATAPVYKAIEEATAAPQEHLIIAATETLQQNGVSGWDAMTNQWLDTNGKPINAPQEHEVLTTEFLKQNGIGGLDMQSGVMLDTDGNPIKKKARKPVDTYSPAAADQMREAGTTQGRKGCKLHRINMGFTDEVYAYITTMARVRGESISDFTRYIFEKSMSDNAEIYEKAKAFKESL